MQRGQFDEDIALEQLDETRFQAQLAEHWCIRGVPNGGYQLAVAANAIGQCLPQPHPLTVTGHYLAASKAGPVELTVDVARVGGSMSTATCRVTQNGRETLRVTATFTDLANAEGPTRVEEQPPDMESPDECINMAEAMGPAFEIHNHIDLRLTPDSAAWARQEQGEFARFKVWTRLADGRDPDPIAMMFYADALPPPFFNVLGMVGAAPTLELTVHVRDLPAPGMLRGRFRNRYIINGFFEEDGEIWDSEGKLVALSRQVGRIMSRGPQR